MIRLHIIAEGPTEETFIRDLLSEHLGGFNISTDVRRVNPGSKPKRSKADRGGVLNYENAKKDIQRWLREDKNKDARFTSMFDLYALPNNFPGFDEAKKYSKPYEKVEYLEQAFGLDINDYRFLPYIQLHEFEALILSEPSKLNNIFVGYEEAIDQLVQKCEGYESPELINEGQTTAPSKRIIQAIPGYSKISDGLTIVQSIGLDNIRSKCHHFNQWIARLENLQL
ncbi:DUF4276 family protein [Microseira sp. BLCC-F43]|jgi:hypothetical protein|uniref:DUF4276 family protein n=1 Tax=Microseira sp. BLCC-F43 TaxID=3153602 RepID=UPI0035BA5765